MAEDLDQSGPAPEPHPSRAVHLFLVAVLAAAVIGFFVGIDQGVPHPDVTGTFEVSSTLPSDVAPATSYLDLQRLDLGPNGSWRSDLARLTRPSLDDIPLTPPGEVEKAAALAMRASRRAFNGAPPLIPHQVDPLSDDNCLACHQESVRIGQATSGLMPHPHLSSCQQCHVAVDGQTFGLSDWSLENSFSGMAAPLAGARAWPGAPPTIPHTTLLRDNCRACHGPTGQPGLRTTHPERQSCMQCHAPSAGLDQAIANQAGFDPGFASERSP